MRKTAIKRFAITVLLLLAILCLSACGKNTGSSVTAPRTNPQAATVQFQSQDEVFDILNGVWVDNAEGEAVFYVFQDEQLLWITQSGFQDATKQLLDSTLENKNVKALCRLDLQAAAQYASTADLLGINHYTVSADVDDGTILADDGQFNSRYIMIEGDQISIQDPDTDTYVSLQRISDEPELSGELIEALFQETKNNYQVSTTSFWTDAREYGDLVMLNNPQIDTWFEPVSTADTLIYKTPDWNTSISGVFTVSDDAVDYVYKQNVSVVWGQDAKPTYLIQYRPSSGSFTIFDKYNSFNLPLMVDYGFHTVKNFPGAFQDSATLYSTIRAHSPELSSGAQTWTMYHNGLTYTLVEQSDGTMGIFEIEADETVTLGDILQWAPEYAQAVPEAVCAQCGTAQDANELDPSGLCRDCQNSIPTVTFPEHFDSFAEGLDCARVWRIDGPNLYGTVWYADLAFAEDGSCYIIEFHGDPADIYKTRVLRCMGTYEIQENTVKIIIRYEENMLETGYYEPGHEHICTYIYDPDSCTFAPQSQEDYFYDENCPLLPIAPTADTTLDEIQKSVVDSIPEGLMDVI